MQISITKHSIQLLNLHQSADLKSVVSSTLPEQRRTILAKKFFLKKKKHVFNQKSQISGFFKKSVLDFKDTPVRL